MRARPKGNERETLEEVLKGVTDPADRVVRMIAWRGWDFWQPQVDKVQRIMSAYWAIVAEHGPDEVVREYLIKQGWKPPEKAVDTYARKTARDRGNTLPVINTVYNDGPDRGRILQDDEFSVIGLAGSTRL